MQRRVHISHTVKSGRKSPHTIGIGTPWHLHRPMRAPVMRGQVAGEEPVVTE